MLTSVIIQSVVVILFLILLFERPDGHWKTHSRKRSLPEAASTIKKMVSEAQAAEIALLKTLIVDEKDTSPSDKLKYFSEKVSAAINYAISRHDWYEEQRFRLFRTILVIATSIFALLGLAVSAKLSENSAVAISMIGFLLIALVSIFFAITWFNGELDQDRPYRSVSDIRFWYFRYNLPEHSENSSAGDGINQARAVISERRRFFDRIHKNFCLENSFREDFEKLFILHVLQRSKSESLSKLRWLLSYVAIWFGFETVILLTTYIWTK